MVMQKVMARSATGFTGFGGEDVPDGEEFSYPRSRYLLMADHNSDEGVSRTNVAIGSFESTGMTDQHSDERVSRDDDDVERFETIDMESSDEGVSRTNVVVGSSESPGVAKQHSDKGLSTSNVAVRSPQLTGGADQHSDAGLSIADVAVESLKLIGTADKHPDEPATTNVENSESTVEINIKTLDSQLHSFNVDKNMPVSMFKEKIARELDLPVEQQRLIFRGKVLKDGDLLSEYHVESGHTLHLVARQPSESQAASGSPNAETTASISNTGQDANTTGTRSPVVGHVSHSVVLGTFGVGDQNEGGNPDISHFKPFSPFKVIGAVLNSFGMGGQTPMGGIGGAQPNMQFSIPVQVAQGNETGASVSNHGQSGNQSQPRSPSQSMPQGLQNPLGAATIVPTLATPIPDSLNTLSEFINRMEQALSQNAYQPNHPSLSTEGLPAVELPSNGHGLLSPTALAVVLRRTQRLLSGPAIDSLSHTAGRLEEEEHITNVTVRTQIQTEAMQSGLAMQHLGALLLELGRTMLTLRIGRSHAESSVNAGPAVYISPLGPNPIMVQPFPLQTNSLFGGNATAVGNPGAFGPIGVGAVPRHLNIHIHAGVGPRATNIETNPGELANRNGQADVVLPEVQTDTGNATSSGTRMKSLSGMESGSSDLKSNTPRNSSSIPLGLGSGGLQPKRRHRQTRSEAGGSGSSTSYTHNAANQSLTSAGGQLDPATIMNQVTQNPALQGLLAGVSNQPGSGSPDFFRNMMSQLAQNPAMMNTINQLAQQMDGNQDMASMLAGIGGCGGGGGGSGNLDMSSMVQQMMPFVSQALNQGSSSSNLLQSVPSRKGTLHRRYSSVKSLNVNERSSDLQVRSDPTQVSNPCEMHDVVMMNLENAAQKIEEQYPALEIFSSIAETAAALYDNVFDTGALDELCSDEELAQNTITLDLEREKKEQQGREMSTEKCIVCDETIDSDELLSIGRVSYHNTCFKCSQCHGTLMREAGDTISEANGDDASASNALTTTSRSLPSAGGQLDLDTILNQSLPSDGGQLDPNTIMNQLMQNLAGVSYQTDFESHDFLRNILDQITQNPQVMDAINRLGQQMDGNQDLGSMFATMNGCQGGGDFDMSFMVQQMMPFLSQALHRGGSSSNLLEHDPSLKHEHHRRCYSDSASLNGLPMDCQANLKEAAQKIEEENSAVEVFSCMVETAALLQDNVHDIYGLAELCSEEELAEEFMEMLKRDVCRRLGKRYVRCNTVP
ncbi:Ubiquitin [Cynara cardunculus var. scolymus]|uniref:Ubiquitin n=1 Tax=Cynara cardunculus var. scolymus TaxID=59895 RepID=A0A103XG42_CYNCS|nr:Ubiquitin [Cynara cardunculus var. scolymus]